MLIPSQRTKIYDAERKCIKKKRRGLSYFACQFSFKPMRSTKALNTYPGHTICRVLHKDYVSAFEILIHSFHSLPIHYKTINAAIFAPTIVSCELERSLLPFDGNEMNEK